MAMAVATSAPILWNPLRTSGPCRHGSNEVRHGQAVRAGATTQWEQCRQACASRARVVCLFGGEKKDAAKRALESALGDKKDAFSKFDQEAKKREEAKKKGGGGGSGNGRGGGGGGGGNGGGGGDSNFPKFPAQSGDDAKQMILAFLGLAALYLVLTQGKSMLAVSVNSALFVMRGFKKSGSSSSRQPSAFSSRPIGDGPGAAESSVMSKWGKD